MKYTGLRNQIAALRAQLPLAGQRIVIEGGVPEAIAAPQSAEPVQLELPLPASPRLSRGAGRVFTKPGSPAEDAPAASAGDPGPAQAPEWEHAWWRDQKRRDRG